MSFFFVVGKDEFCERVGCWEYLDKYFLYIIGRSVSGCNIEKLIGYCLLRR